ncbi:roundabout homolog 2-like isoform X3 [Chanodichthys erythropterus]|uniref:roundabout homolog 2-like isoform X3 n=1 Tax=Chanodichthys erythropterus TaxID=933992 RepID=UPI00351E57DD
MPTCKILLFLLLALCTSCGECDVTYGQVGGEVIMDCEVPQNTDVEWKLNDTLIIKINGRRGTKQKGSSHIKDKVSVNGGSLKVPRLETRDSGVYSCNSGKRTYTLHVASVFAKPGPVLLQSSDAELHCDIGENPNTEVEWQRPSNDKKKDKKVIKLNSVTSNDDGQWTCLFKDLKLTLTLAVVAGLQTRAVKVPEGENITLPCSLPRSVSQRVVGGKWTADHIPTVSFPTLNTETKGLHWSGNDSSKVTFTSDRLNINYDVMLTNAQPSDEGKYVCTVEFEGGVKLTAETNLTVVSKSSVNTGGQRPTEKKGKTSAGGVTWKKEVFGLQLWIWIAVGASSVVLIVLIIVTVLVRQRNKRMKRVKKLRSMRQPLTAKDYCRCRAESEVELVQQERPLPVPRQQRNPRTRTAGPNHTIEKRREQDY